METPKPIYLYYTRFTEQIAPQKWNKYLTSLPLPLQKRCERFIKWQDRHSFVLGKLLLKQCLAIVGINEMQIANLRYNDYGKPFLYKKIDFNISHSGEHVVCAIGEKLRLGIDIETIKDIEFDDFSEIMTKSQWSYIYNSKNKLQSFYELWTAKESVIKAEGKGLSIPILDINVYDNVVQLHNNKWYLTDFCFENQVCGCLATSVDKPNLIIRKIDFC